MALEDFSKYTRITVNPAIPKNEKDLICALLAGRLRNLFNGKLFCLNLAISDLIKDASGYGLTDLVDGLKGLQGSLNDFKNEVGYDKILGSINQALGGIGTVFSLGGLCPSPITPPRIPDIMPMVNAQLFGQGMNIINALGKALNPTMCFGGGPGGFGVNYNTMPGALQQLKNSLNRFANDPAGLKQISKAFEANIKMQERRLKSEVNRLKTNLSDPFGIQLAKQRATALKAAHNRGADYAVVDKNGIARKNTIKNLVPGDTLALLNAADNTPILYKREAVLNYCGDEVGIKLVPVSGDIDYAGWDTNPATDNSDRPFGLHRLPEPGDQYYDFIIKEEYNEIKILKYNQDTSTTESVTSIALTRGKEYRIKLSLINYSVSIVQENNTPWSTGIEVSIQTGAGIEIFEETQNLKQGEIDWGVLIENPTTPNNLKLKFSNGTTLPIVIDGPTAIPAIDKTYDLADIVLKAAFFQQEVNSGLDDVQIPGIETRTDIKLNCYAKLTTANNVFESTQVIEYNAGLILNSYRYIDDPDSEDTADKILEIKSNIGNLILVKKFNINDSAGISIRKASVLITDNTTTGFAVIELEDPLTIINNTKLPYKDYYKQRISAFGGNNVTADETEFILLNDTTIRWFLTKQRPTAVSNTSWMAYYDIDITDISNPFLSAVSVEIKNDPYNLVIKLNKIN